jgi:hypothetical protein
LMT